MPERLYATKFEARIALANHPNQQAAFIDQTDNGWYRVRTRCAYCGAAKVNGRCPVSKRDCGRP